MASTRTKPAGTPPRRRPGRRPRSSAARSRADERRLRPLVERLVAEAIEDRLDYLESEASVEDGAPVPADEVWRRLGI